MASHPKMAKLDDTETNGALLQELPFGGDADAVEVEENADENANKRIMLKAELQCEIYDFMPMEQQIQLLRLDVKLYELNMEKTSANWQSWQKFSIQHLQSIFAKHHPLLVNFDAIVEAWKNFKDLVNCFKSSLLPNSLRDALQLNERARVVNHLTKCISSIDPIHDLEGNDGPPYYLDIVYWQIYRLIEDALVECVPFDPSAWNLTDMSCDRLFRFYLENLGIYRERLNTIKDLCFERREFLYFLKKQSKKDLKTMRALLETIAMEKDSFNASEWLAEMNLEELEFVADFGADEDIGRFPLRRVIRCNDKADCPYRAIFCMQYGFLSIFIQHNH